MERPRPVTCNKQRANNKPHRPVADRFLVAEEKSFLHFESLNSNEGLIFQEVLHTTYVLRLTARDHGRCDTQLLFHDRK
jgi:hypothetical protein